MAESKSTLYVILSGDYGSDEWREIDRIEASGQVAAQNAAYQKYGANDRMRVACVPAKSWMPTLLGIRSKPIITREEIGAPTPTAVTETE